MFYAWFDGSTHVGRAKSGIGWYIKDGKDRFVHMRSKEIPFNKNSTAVEYYALIDLLTTLNLKGINDVVIKGDNKVVIVESSGRILYPSSFAKCREQAQNLIRGIDGAQLLWIPRKENRIADALSKSAY